MSECYVRLGSGIHILMVTPMILTSVVDILISPLN